MFSRKAPRSAQSSALRVSLLQAAVLLLASFRLAPAASAQVVPHWTTFDRGIEYISVRPSSSRRGEAEVLVHLSARTEFTRAELALPTILVVSVNGEPVHREVFELSTGGTAAAGCNTNCAEIFQHCVCIEGTGLCGCGNLLWNGIPVSIPLEEGDEVVAALLYPRGSPVDEDSRNDRLAIEVDTDSVRPFYNRKVSSVALRPSEENAEETEVEVEVEVDARPSVIDRDLSFLVMVELDGEPMAQVPMRILAETQQAAGGCNINCAEIGEVCVCWEGTNFCSCGTLVLQIPGLPGIPVPASQLDPERLEVFLVPMPGALPELPGFGDDDEAQPEPPTDTTRPFRRGDSNHNGGVELGDVIFSLNFLFQTGAAPVCDDAADANDDGQLDIGDPIATLGFLFGGDAPPPFPGPFRCGSDPTRDRLGCAGYRFCEPR